MSPTVRVGGAIDRAQACLRFFGDDLDPDEITRALGHFPTTSFRKGDDGRTVGGWILDGPATDPPRVENVIRALLALLSRDRRMWRRLTRRFKADIFCGLFMDEFNRGFELSPSLTRELALRGVTVGFDIYGPGMVSLDGAERPDLGALLARGQLPSKRLLSTMARRELKDGSDLASDLWIVVASAVLDDAALFDEVVSRHWQRRRKRRRGQRITEIGGRHRRARAAKDLATRARAVVALAPPALAAKLIDRLTIDEAGFRQRRR